MKNLSWRVWTMGMFLSIAVFNRTAGALCPCAEDPNDSPAAAIQTILDQMHQTAQTVQTLQADLTYLFVQDPELLDAKTLRQGKLFYVQGSRGARSHLRISFETVQQDEEPPQPRLEHYLFDGVWLTKIDMSLETVDRYQKAPADKPVGVFEFISHNFPMVGFTDPKTLQNEFEIVPSPVPQDPNQPQHLSLKVRPGSRYKEDYTEMEVWIDRKIWLPVRLTAKSVQGDFYDLKWTNIRMNEKIAENVFQIETPSNFRQNSHPLEQNPS